jgi:hypothetical protein
VGSGVRKAGEAIQSGGKKVGDAITRGVNKLGIPTTGASGAAGTKAGEQTN